MRTPFLILIVLTGCATSPSSKVISLSGDEAPSQEAVARSAGNIPNPSTNGSQSATGTTGPSETEGIDGVIGLTLAPQLGALVSLGEHTASVELSSTHAITAHLLIEFAAPLSSASTGIFTCTATQCEANVAISAGQTIPLTWTFVGSGAASFVPVVFTLSGADAVQAVIARYVSFSQGALSDEFVGDTLTGWIDDDPSKHDVLIQSGDQLRLQPTPSATNSNGWFREGKGPFLYRTVTGNFIVETRVHFSRANRSVGTNFGEYSSAGFLLRSPTSAPLRQRWVAFNFGYQTNELSWDTFSERFGTELKWTREAPVAGNQSDSSLYINRTPMSDVIELRACRVGADLRFFTRPDATSAWTEQQMHDYLDNDSYDYAQVDTHFRNCNVPGSASCVTTGNPFDDGAPIHFDSGTWGETVQVGMMANDGYDTHETRADFDYVRFADVTSLAECAAPL